MAKAFGGKRPQNLRHTLRRFGDYLATTSANWH